MTSLAKHGKAVVVGQASLIKDRDKWIILYHAYFRPVNTCDYKPSRPFRIITGSEDNTSAIYEGPPFKFKTTKKVHTDMYS